MKNYLIKDNVENSEMCNKKKKSKDQIVIDYVYKNIFNKNIFLNIFKRNNYNGIEKNKTITKKDTSNIDIEKRKEEIKNYKKEKNNNEEYLLFLSYVYNDLISFIENDKEYHLKNSEFSDIEDLIIDICGNICHKSFNNIKKIFSKSQKDQEEGKDQNNVYSDMNDKWIDAEINKNKNYNEPSFFFIPPMEFIVSHIYKLNSNLNKNYVCKERENIQAFIKNNNYDKKCNILNNILNNEPPLNSKEDEIQNEFENKANKKKKNSIYIYLSRMNDKSISNGSQDEKSKFSLEKEIKISEHKLNDSIFEYPYKEINESSDYTHDSDGYNSSSQDELISESANSLETFNEQICNEKSRHNTSQNGTNIPNEQNENEILNVPDFKENKIISNISMNESISYKEKDENETNSKHVDNLNNYYSLKCYDSNSLFSKSFNFYENIKHDFMCSNDNKNKTSNTITSSQQNNNCHILKDENDIYSNVFKDKEIQNTMYYMNNDNSDNRDDNDNNSIANEGIKRVVNIANSINPIEAQNVLGTYENNSLCEDNNIMTNIELAKINSNKLIKYTNYNDSQINNVCINYEERQNNIKENIIVNIDDKIKIRKYDKHSFENKQLIIKHNEYYEKLNKMLINKKEKIYKEQKEYTKNNNLHDDYYYFKYVNTYENNLNPYCYTKILKKANIKITRSPFPQFLRDIQIYNIPTKKIRLKKTNIALKTENAGAESKTQNNERKRNKVKNNKKKEMK
ncbi:conserved Plasmodium protein, unknown function [Plasmodium berghei]|uniref:Uncharacterized protein n=2 Tax=Plasmodium berghei TaxID=5821 RepID=A0A509AKJ7_PLABA|nr:conserved Plasmodium protein, unknown function [Plasmodium berghei ANKA]CXI46049.1 conserved Plasmodium protein, unknown function [Plasmodium berghei]SCM22743.1 conserved Plasmodium protein, unknown function [Plasmodium berghei]SCN25648.1 conserved Plasmodium protein, unknown function [Plasmodium berghei]SCO60581.1 conserved Plasmodium protein, unknown function [Plasmodium berghei]SCO62323.1 conserved Plasmodium protein, unknown function [Plasmodium berghei]|eukprot:XP_034421740.1 conserved Plasmodium protein, unknown function [Plasmodium berghei ANKA]